MAARLERNALASSSQRSCCATQPLSHCGGQLRQYSGTSSGPEAPVGALIGHGMVKLLPRMGTAGGQGCQVFELA